MYCSECENRNFYQKNKNNEQQNDRYFAKKERKEKRKSRKRKHKHNRDLTLKSTKEPPCHRIKMIVSISFENLNNLK